MSYFISEDQAAFRDAAQVFAAKEIAPLANQIDREERTPPELTRKVADSGFFGMLQPEKYGGGGADLTSACLVLEEFAKASPAFAGLVSVQMILLPLTVLAIGNEEQQQRLLPKSASGERLLAWSQSEPAGSTNLDAHRTKLTRDGDTFRLNGEKIFCTQGDAKTFLVMCRTEQDGKQGYGCVIVEREQKGFAVAPYEPKLGWRGTKTGGVSFTDVVVPPENVVGDLLTSNSQLFLVANQPSFLGHSATSLGCAVGMFEKTMEYVKTRNLYGEPMWKLSPWTDVLGSAWHKIEAMRALLYTATRLFDEGRRDLMLGTTCKAWLCETAFEVCNSLLHAWGGSGIMDPTGINRYFRDARTNLIAEGGTHMHTHLTATFVLGLGADDKNRRWP